MPPPLRGFYRELAHTHPELRGLLRATAVSWLAVLLVVPLDLFATVVLATFAALLAFLVPAVVVRIVIHEDKEAARRVTGVRCA